jgi:hypothetical protein
LYAQPLEIVFVLFLYLFGKDNYLLLYRSTGKESLEGKTVMVTAR